MIGWLKLNFYPSPVLQSSLGSQREILWAQSLGLLQAATVKYKKTNTEPTVCSTTQISVDVKAEARPPTPVGSPAPLHTVLNHKNVRQPAPSPYHLLVLRVYRCLHMHRRRLMRRVVSMDTALSRKLMGFMLVIQIMNVNFQAWVLLVHGNLLFVRTYAASINDTYTMYV